MSCNVKTNKIDYYTPESRNFEDFPVEQTVLLRETYIQTIPFLKYEKERECTASADEWYLYTNSYYNHTEDTDALEKVSALLVQPEVLPPPVPDLKDNKNKFDPYSEQEAQQKYLESRPVSFIILGKPDIGQQELGRRLTDHWKCVYIEPQMLIEEEIVSGSREGQCIEFNLRCGRAIGVDIILKLVERATKSNMAKHRGFVLCGLPVIPNDFYEEDPMSSQSAIFTATDIFENILDSALPQEELVEPSSKPQVSVSSKFKSEERVVDEFSSRTNFKSDVSVLKFKSDERINKSDHQFKEPSAAVLLESKAPSLRSDLATLPLIAPDQCTSTSTLSEEREETEIGLNYEKQLEILFGFLQDPFIIIYIQCSSVDVLNKRNSYRFDFIFKQSLDMQRRKYNKIYQNYLETDGSIDNILLEGMIDDYSEVDDFRLKNLVKMPRDFKVNVSSQLDKYHQVALNFVEARVLSHNPQYFIKVDGRTSIACMLEIVKTKLIILPLQKVIVPRKINKHDIFQRQESLDTGDHQQQQEEIEDAEKLSAITPEEEFKTLRAIGTPSKFFKWELSDWQTMCPVALKMGFKIKGHPDNAVQFMNKLFFLSSEQFFTKFFKNPRPYLLSPNPRPCCKIFIFGPRLSGKSALAQCLAYYYNATILNTTKMIKEYLREKQDEYMEKIKQNAIAEGIKLLNELRKKEAKELEIERVAKIKEWAKHAVELLEELVRFLEEREAEQKKEVFEISAFPMAMKSRAGVEENVELMNALAHIRTELEELNIPIPALQVHVPQGYLKERRKLLAYLPPNLTKKHIPKPATVFDDFVIEYVQEALDRAGLANVQLGGNSMLEMFLSNIRAAEEKYIAQRNSYGGWIIDGMILNVDLLKNFYPYYAGDEVILLKDNGDYSFLSNRYEEKQQTFFHDYRSFFKSIGENDAAWRCPSNEDLLIDVEDLVSEMLTEILEDDSFYEAPEESDVLPRVVEYIKDVSKFYKQWNVIQEFYEERGIQPIEINVAGKEFPDLFKEVIQKIQNIYRAKASIAENEIVVSDEQTPDHSEIETRTDAEEETTFREADDEIAATNPDLLKNYGNSYHFCPVTFFEDFVLWKGKDDIAANFNGKTYLFATKNDLSKFLLEPRKYSPSNYVQIFPPPRICVIGVSTCGRTYISRALSNNYGLIYVSFESLLKKHFQIEEEETFNQINHHHIKSYLESDEPLPEDFYLTLLKYWFAEPFKSRGFVFDDFPKRKVDVEFMVKHKLIPDVVLILEAEEKYTKKKLLERTVRIWQESIRKQRDEIKLKNEKAIALWKEKKLEKFKQMLEERRQDRYAKKLEEVKFSVSKSRSNKTNSDDSESSADTDESRSEVRIETNSEIFSQVSFDSVADQQDVDEINKILDETELPPTLISPPSDDPTEVITASTPIVNELVDHDLIIIKGLRERCTTELIPFSQVVLNLDEFEKTKISAFLNADKLKFRTISFFEVCYDVSLGLAEKLLTCGYFFLSKFGRTCPVQYFINENPVQMYLLNEENGDIYPIVHRSYVYFIGGLDQRNKFKSDPLKYVGVNFNFPLLQFRVAVSGPPLCGKTFLSKRIHKEYGLKYITRGDACRYVLKYLSQSALASNMKIVLKKGWELTNEMVVGCVEAATFDKWAIAQGVVFDGFPNTIQELKHLSYSNLVPNLVINLQAKVKDILRCLELDKKPYTFKKYGEKFVLHMNEEWSKENEDFGPWFDKEYQVTRVIAINPSNWSIWKASQGYILSTFWEIKHYHEHIEHDWPVRLGNMLVTPLEFVERRSGYRSFCPCCLHYFNILKNGGEPPDRTGLVQFRDFYYWICSSHLEEFLKTPEMFLSPYNKHKMPASLPKRVRFNVMPDNVFENGSCTVCYKEKRIIIKGCLDFCVEYNEKVYLFDTVDCLNSFLKAPQLYMFGIEFRAPVYPPVNYTDLPVLGMLEQYVAKYIIKGISHISRRRPVIPGLSITASALIGLGLFIKIHNENCPETLKPYYEEGFRLYNKRRDDLLSHLDYMKRTRNPCVHYQEPLPDFKLPPRQKTLTGADIVAEILKEILENVETWCGNTEDQNSFKSRASRVPVPDERFDYLCEYFKPLSKVPAFLNVVDIAGLVKGASEGQGLGNAFLSHISACDAIFHLCRAFDDDDVIHVDGEVNPIRDLETISEELRLKDEDQLLKNLDKLEKTAGRGGDKKLKPEYDALLKFKSILVDEKKALRFGDYDGKDIEFLNKALFLTTKPVIYLVNLSEKDYIKRKNKWLPKIKEWIDKNDPGALMIPFSGALEHKLVTEYEDPVLRKKFLEDQGTTSALDKIIVQGYKALQLEYFFTAGADEVKAWTIQKGTKAPQAAGRIHTDFEKGFIMAEVMKFDDFKAEGSEAACKAAGKYRQQGKTYVVDDGDIIFFKFNAGAGLQTGKKPK